MSGILKILGIVSFAVLALHGCDQAQKPIRLGTNIWPGYEPLYLAQRLGLLDVERVRLVGYPSATDVIEAFRNGSLEAASLTLDEALTLLDKEVPIKIILVHDVSDGADVIIARPGIETVADLRGRAVGVESTALGAYVISRALAINCVELADVRIKHLDVNQHEDAYRKGDIDAAVTFEPFRTRLLAMGAHEIFSSRELPGEIVDVLVVRQKVYDKRMADLRHITQGWFGALAFLAQEPSEAAAEMAKRLRINPDEVLASLQVIRFPDLEENIALLSGRRAELLSTLGNLSRTMKDKGLIRHDVSGDEILTPDALP
jgi:NitT/TauT family transport system substrate-binding protein